ncbi:MAG: hypothetical protein IPJ32_08245 [Sphingobacteriaceae bacterium]|nr:hypothetical protein [Sphingobacteriaceae bacterium]
MSITIRLNLRAKISTQYGNVTDFKTDKEADDFGGRTKTTTNRSRFAKGVL